MQIVKGVSFEALYRDWPLLFHHRWFLYHFQILVGINAHQMLMQNLQQNGIVAVKYAEGKARCAKEMCLVRDACRELNSRIPEFIGAISLLPILMSEDLNYLFYLVKVCTLHIIFHPKNVHLVYKIFCLGSEFTGNRNDTGDRPCLVVKGMCRAIL